MHSKVGGTCEKSLVKQIQRLGSQAHGTEILVRREADIIHHHNRLKKRIMGTTEFFVKVHLFYFIIM
jgi:hypothetical protein